MFYLTKTPKWVFKLFNRSIWQMPDIEKSIYLTFDDGPHPDITPFVLEELDKFNAKATFFCIGKNVVKYPLVYNKLLEGGHAVGNHTFNHWNGWNTKADDYVHDVLLAKEHVESDLFRPPYGRITRKQHRQLTNLAQPFKIIMWSVLSGDFDVRLSPQRCYSNILKNVKSGSVVVFHDSEKANERLRFVLPLMLKHFTEEGFLFKRIDFTK